MLILLDNGVPRGIVSALAGHDVKESRKLSWDRLSNGELLNVAEAAGYDLLITTDQNMRHQQNLSRRKIALVVVGKGRWSLIKPHASRVAEAVNAATPGSYTEVEIPG